ncbi:hypothetical protein [Halalkalibacter alkaliphilus]|uniref:Uncharacterized protein n=1 Tax=Halalkalibacter alkaliphilus TaxID=2917993 RepID=A0A9X2CSZ2_9BACI|nr:hypothetical protein [Halalkalibacter alkaliphilus]MCL7747545.1 hypothetical protein [Halalkalibacter alkaliphilus]
MDNLSCYEQPLLGRISIHQVEGELVDSRLSTIVILEIRKKSLLFVSQLKFPLSESVIYHVDLKLADNRILLFGCITQSISNSNSTSYHYQYDYILNTDQFLPINSSKLPNEKEEKIRFTKKADKEI